LFWRNVFLALLLALLALSFFPALRRSRRRPARFEPDRPYQAYTREFDVEIDADGLDGFLAALQDSGQSWSKRFPAVDAVPLFALEKELAARREAGGPKPAPIRADDAVVTLLIDHSGSMRGQPMLFAARAALVASDLLDGLGAKLEVLGFTTARWKGGRSREKWLRDGQPSYPGRLNDLLHVVHCSAGQRLSARHCAAMLQPGLLKENIDGEAIEWAAARLRRRDEGRKYLIVLSDGAPVDDSTLLENGIEYLDHHLHRVIKELELAGDIRLAAIGIGRHVERHYERRTVVTSPEELERATAQLIAQLLSQPH
jgi:cobaltochelatase CobT